MFEAYETNEVRKVYNNDKFKSEFTLDLKRRMANKHYTHIDLENYFKYSPVAKAFLR